MAEGGAGFFGDMGGEDSEGGDGESQGDGLEVGGGGRGGGGFLSSSVPARAWGVDGKFTKVTAWQHDTPATEHDIMPRALGWIALAQKIHSV